MLGKYLVHPEQQLFQGMPEWCGKMNFKKAVLLEIKALNPSLESRLTKVLHTRMTLHRYYR
jgi:hypothetical protein